VSLAVLAAIVGRIVFLARTLGAVVSVKVSIGFEVAGAFLLVVWLVFTKSPINWIEVLLFLIFSVASVLLQLFDDRLYLYIIDEEKEE
jgi:hypothetical protein